MVHPHNFKIEIMLRLLDHDGVLRDLKDAVGNTLRDVILVACIVPPGHVKVWPLTAKTLFFSAFVAVREL